MVSKNISRQHTPHNPALQVAVFLFPHLTDNLIPTPPSPTPQAEVQFRLQCPTAHPRQVSLVLAVAARIVWLSLMEIILLVLC